jgi:calcineurin-like phosphoesterase family protein
VVDVWLISDTHFGHENIIKYCNRPFKNAAEMDATIISRWNDVVKPQDHVYHLGDVAVSQETLNRVMPCLNGHLRLILGNHDNMAPIETYAKYFDKILVWRLFKPLILTHVPIHQASFGKAKVNVHGHIHDKPAYGAEYVNVCVEQTDYAPVHLDSILSKVK